jgi:hypothetical protein
MQFKPRVFDFGDLSERRFSDVVRRRGRQEGRGAVGVTPTTILQGAKKSDMDT